MNVQTNSKPTSLFSLFALLCLIGSAGCGAGGLDGTIVVLPKSAAVATGQTQQFHSSNVENIPKSVSWKVQEGSRGGTIEVVQVPDAALDEVINYTAPQTPGTYHVQVTGKYIGGYTKTATATVEVK